MPNQHPKNKAEEQSSMPLVQPELLDSTTATESTIGGATLEAANRVLSNVEENETALFTPEEAAYVDYLINDDASPIPSLMRTVGKIDPEVAVAELLDNNANPEAVLSRIASSKFPHLATPPGVRAFLDRGVNPNSIFRHLAPRNEYQNALQIPEDEYDIILLRLIQAGGDPEEIIKNMSQGSIMNKTTELLLAGVAPRLIYEHISPPYLAYVLPELKKVSNDFDIEDVVKQLNPFEQFKQIDRLKKLGANIDVAELVSKIEKNGNAFYIMELLESISTIKRLAPDMNLDAFVKRQRPLDRISRLSLLKENGINENVEELFDEVVASGDSLSRDTVDELLNAGIDATKIFNYILKEDEPIITLGSGIITKLAAAGASDAVSAYLKTLNDDDRKYLER